MCVWIPVAGPGRPAPAVPAPWSGRTDGRTAGIPDGGMFLSLVI